MRMFSATVVFVLLIEALLAGGFVAGYYWLDSWQYGLLISAGLLLLLTLPWLGELRVEYDSATECMIARIGWWGRMRLTRKPDPVMELRVCGIPYRRKLDRDKSAAGEAPAEKPARSRKKQMHIGAHNIADVMRAAGAAAGAGNDLIWDARELHLQVDSPSQHKMPDDILGRVVGHRGVGPLDLKLTAGDGNRRIRARYRIGLFRALVTLAVAACQGRMWTLKSLRQAPPQTDAGSTDATDEDRALIAELHKQLQDRGQEKEEE
ncbi:MAG: hypothetical protein J7M38_12920 [Armatimonadetes bacterium]|nr:hypothetical protein [Armatimonadota bacterium]